ncbi:MAG: hypothetical protein BACD_02655 [Bacteroides rodentium]
MIKRNLFRQILASVFTILAACVSVNATAQEGLFKVSTIQFDYRDIFSTAGTMDENCNEWAQSRGDPHGSFYRFYGKRDGDSPREVHCWVTRKQDGQIVPVGGSSMQASCPGGGGLYSNHPDGCYSTTPPEPEPEFPPNHPLCSNINRMPGELATVACNQDERHPCFWPDALDTFSQNPKTRQIIYTCAIEHEQIHIIDPKTFCRSDGSLGLGDDAVNASEAHGFATEETCLRREINQCQGDGECISEINERIQQVINERIKYENQM